MFKRVRTLAMAPFVPLSSGNVEVVTTDEQLVHWALPRPRPEDASAEELREPDGVLSGWSIRHLDGEIVRANIATRADASRMLGSLAAHGAALPLLVYGPDGEAIGERLG